MGIAQDSCRISVRYRPSGELRVRLQSLRPLQKTTGSKLVYSCEVQDFATEEGKNGLRSGFGKLPKATNFGKLGKERVRDACAILDQTFGKSCLFVTGTLPGSTPDAYRAIAEWSGYIVSRLKQWIRDNAPEVRTVWVWELQKRGALHLHAVMGGSDKKTLELLQCKWHRLWCHVLSQVSKKAAIDLFARTNGATWANNIGVVRTDAQFVQKSVARYLSKYVSKTAGTKCGDTPYYPSRWWGIDAWLTRKIMEATVLRIFPVQKFSDAIGKYMTLITGLSLDAEKWFQWRGKYDVFGRTFVCWLRDGNEAAVP